MLYGAKSAMYTFFDQEITWNFNLRSIKILIFYYNTQILLNVLSCLMSVVLYCSIQNLNWFLMSINNEIKTYLLIIKKTINTASEPTNGYDDKFE